MQCSQRLLYCNQGVICCTCGHLLVESESIQKCNKLRLDALFLPHYVIKKGDPIVLGTVKLKQRNSATSPSTRGRDVSREITKEFTIVSYETLYIVIRNSKNWLDRAEVHQNGQIGTGRPLLPSIQRGIPEISKHWYLIFNRPRVHRDLDQSSELQSQS